MIVDRRSLRHRLTLFYTTVGAIVLATAGIALTFVAFAVLTRPLALTLAQAVRDVEATAAASPANDSTRAIQRRIVRNASRSGIKLIAIPPEAMRDAPPKLPPGEISVASLLGLSADFVPVRDAAIVVIPDGPKIDGLLRIFLLVAGGTSVFAVIVAWLIARIITRQSLAPLLTVTAELERFASGDFTPRPLAVADRTELGALAAAYNGAADQVTQAFLERRRVEDQIRQFVAEAGHELRTPLTVVAGYVDVLRRGGDRDPAIRQAAFASLGIELKRMRALVERLMTLARLDRVSESQHEVVDVGAIVGQVVDALTVTSDVPIRLATQDDLVVLGEPGDVYEAVANLIENALKYGEHSAVAVDVTARGDEIAVRVRDGGPGISEVHRPRIFERFYRCSDSDGIAGSGLGLAIAAKAAERLEGRLVLENADPGATTFALIVPALPEVLRE